jgi:hypothetical protein
LGGDLVYRQGAKTWALSSCTLAAVWSVMRKLREMVAAKVEGQSGHVDYGEQLMDWVKMSADDTTPLVLCYS